MTARESNWPKRLLRANLRSPTSRQDCPRKPDGQAAVAAIEKQTEERVALEKSVNLAGQRAKELSATSEIESSRGFAIL
jgi:hypothetical protein